MNRLRHVLCLSLAVAILLAIGTAFAGENDALFEQAAAALLSPKALALQTGACSLRPGDTAYVPSVEPEITPFDEITTQVLPAVDGTFETSDATVLTVDATGRMTAMQEGYATVTYHASTGDVNFAVTVSATAIPQKAQAFVYVARREFYLNKKARLPKYNQYAKWYYGKKKEVGWCSVFTIWCANASGNNPVQEESLTSVADSDVVYFREGQVGNQYDGFSKLNRFTGIPRPGYLVIYGDRDNGYRTTHIAIVVDVADRGAGIYQVTTVEGNMSNTVKSYCYLYDSNADNHTVGVEKGKKLQENMSALPAEEQTDPLVQYKLHTDHWCVFGFGASWL
jgi:hypothetical protein